MNDILTTGADGDLAIDNGDLIVGYSDFQHQEHLLVAQKGQYKQNPDVGVGVESFLRDSEIDLMLNEVRNQFFKDGMNVKAVAYDEQTGQLTFDADYNN